MNHNHITRLLETAIEENAKSFPALIICGARQVGKTTILEIYRRTRNKDIAYVTLDDPIERKLAKTDPALFLERYGTPLIIDEMQYATELLPYIKMQIDRERMNHKEQSNGLFFLTGSQMFALMKNVSESLAGRVCVMDIYGLSNAELSGGKQEFFLPDFQYCKNRDSNQRLTINELFERILRGSFPELYQNDKIVIEKFYSSYVRTYLERDIRDMAAIKDETKFLTFMSAAAARTGQECNYSDIAKDAQIDMKTAVSWLSLLRTSGLVFLLQPYHNNLIKKIIKRPKLYFTDTGLACYLAGYSDSVSLERSAFNGAVFETFIVMEIVKSFANANKDPRLYMYYYRDTNGKEIDLVININNTLYPIEIKKSGNPGRDAVKNFDVLAKTKQEQGEGGVICMAEKVVPINEKYHFIPVQCI